MSTTKQTTAQNLGIYINTARIVACFNSNGSNELATKEIKEFDKSIDELKKKGAVKPVADFLKPKKPLATDSEEVKNNYNTALVDYEKKKSEFDELMKTYDKYSSEEYKQGLLTYKLVSKLTKLIVLLEKDKISEPLESRKQQIANLVEQLKGGIKKPIITETTVDGKKKYTITGQEISMKFTDLYDIPTGDQPDIDTLKVLHAKVSFEHAATLKLFSSKNKIAKSCVRFDKSVNFGVAYFVQEVVANLMTLAIKDCAKAKEKLTVSLENFRQDVLGESPYYTLFANLKSTQTLKSFLQRQKDHEQTKSILIAKGIKNNVFKKFEEVERSTKFTFVENGKTKWVGLNVAAGDEDFSTFIGKIFDVAKSQVKSKGTTSLRISSRAKEFVSNLVLQFLQSLTQRFNIYINHKCKIEPNIKSGGEVKKRQEEKSIKFETLVMTLEMLLCSDNDTMKTNNDTVKLLIDKICTFKSKLREINQLKLKK